MLSRLKFINDNDGSYIERDRAVRSYKHQIEPLKIENVRVRL